MMTEWEIILLLVIWGSSAYGCALWLLYKNRKWHPRKKRQRSQQESTTDFQQTWEDQICEYTKEISNID